MSTSVLAYVYNHQHIEHEIGADASDPGALPTLFEDIGKMLPNDLWSSISAGYLARVDDALREKALPSILDVLYRGSPFSPGASSVDSDVHVGFVRADEVETMLEKFSNVELAGEVGASVSEFIGWLNAASSQTKQAKEAGWPFADLGLITFLS